MKLNEKVLDDLTALKLEGMCEALKAQMASADVANMDFLSRLDDMLAKQLEVCQNKKLAYLQKAARLRWPNMTVADLDYSLFPSLKQAKVNELAFLNWVVNCHHVIITGATGTGKTTIACALANKAISEGIPVLYFRFNELILNLVAADKQEKLTALRRKLLKTPLIVLDDWGISPLSSIERHLLFELIESRDKKGSMLITSQYPVKSWYDAFQDPTLADATLDRIVHQTHEINLKGGSIRKAIGMQEVRHGQDK
ncbi:IS21-like element helper ATPase IstB [Ningiella sp. W23]|uniref:IS21-like element helper ATPase IstB n=1 Tax=Ningiella sp. W23 TaxID=3023715 RepID=UPI00375688AF